MAAKLVDGSKYLHIGVAAKLLRMTVQRLRRYADAGEVDSIRRPGGQRLFPVGGLHAYAQRTGKVQQAAEAVDAIAYAMMREGKSDEAIVVALQISLERVLKLREHREGAKPVVKDEAAESEHAVDAALAARRRELASSLEREREERKRRLTG